MRLTHMKAVVKAQLVKEGFIEEDELKEKIEKLKSLLEEYLAFENTSDNEDEDDEEEKNAVMGDGSDDDY